MKIHINPGHGGWDSDDRGIATPLYPTVGPELGFWESQCNLDKGLQLREMLEESGASVQMSRTQNRTEDDLPLSVIVRMANEYQADFMLAIHSNAGSGTANYVLQLYSGKDLNDTQVYPTPILWSDESRAISTEIAKNQFKNQLTHWTSANYSVYGDKTYARMFMGWNDGYGVLRGLTVPGVISEGSMHDYIPENYRLMNMEYKWLEAWNFKKAFSNYFKNAEIPTGNIAGWVKDSRNLILDGTYKKYDKDLLLPIDGAVVTIEETGETYTVDNQRNGVYVFKDLSPGDYTVKVEAEGYYPQETKISVLNNETTYLNFELNKVRNTPPQVLAFSPDVPETETVEASTDIVLEFNWDMDVESTIAAFSITPEAEGDFSFEDSQYRLRFKPFFPLEKSTLYTVKLDKSAKHPDNLSMEEDFIFQFTTKERNRLALLQGYPNEGNAGVYAKKPLFMYVFDKKLDSSNARDEINVYDSNGVMIDKVTRSVKINKIGDPYGDFSFELSNPLIAGNAYTVEIGSNLKDEAGVKFVEPIEIHFTASEVLVEDKSVIDDFEASGKYSYDTGKSEGVSSASIVRSTSQKLFGDSGYKITAKFSNHKAFAAFNSEEPLSNTESSKVFGLHVYGDMSGNELQLQFEAGSEVKFLKLCDLNFMGWEFFEAELVENGVYQLTGFRIVRKENILSASTDIIVDNLLQYDALISGLNENQLATDVRVYPNPVSENLFVILNETEAPDLKLFSINGILLKSVKGNQIGVNEFAPGTYILKVIAKDKVVSKVVMISR
ncbi:hypothetical protein MASR2M47_41710 [Draconibacterium sp.]